MCRPGYDNMKTAVDRIGTGKARQVNRFDRPRQGDGKHLARMANLIDLSGHERGAVFKIALLGPKCALWVEAEVEAWISDVAKT
jgi:hypothetical protein